MIRAVVAVLLVASSSALAAEDVIEVMRGPSTTAFGSCVPSLIAVNRSRAPIDYVQVDIDFSLRDGRSHRHEFKSSYRHGAPRPIEPGTTRPLVIHADESQPMKGTCGDIVSVRVIDAICERDDKPCQTPIAVKVER